MLERILPPPVVAVETFGDVPGATLFPEEAAVVARSVSQRRTEFASARACARAALAQLGEPPAPILPGARGAPQWPAGLTGSITHCDGYRAAAVARAADVVTLGLDAEPNEALPDGVYDLIALASEQARLADLPAGSSVCWDRLLFCAKEAVYKAWFPVAQRWLDFHEADITIAPAAPGADVTVAATAPGWDVTIHPAFLGVDVNVGAAAIGADVATATITDDAADIGAVHGTFCARLLVPGPVVAGAPLTELRGRWLAARGLLLTAIAVPARPA